MNRWDAGPYDPPIEPQSYRLDADPSRVGYHNHTLVTLTGTTTPPDAPALLSLIRTLIRRVGELMTRGDVLWTLGQGNEQRIIALERRMAAMEGHTHAVPTRHERMFHDYGD